MCQVRLGVIYHEGEGVSRDYKEAVKWFRKAAERGEPFAQRFLGFCYLYAQGVPQDYVLAHKWFNLSAANPAGKTYKDAVLYLEKVAAKMTPEEIAEAEQLAREWKPRSQTNDQVIDQ